MGCIMIWAMWALDFILIVSVIVSLYVVYSAMDDINRDIAELKAVTRWLGIKRSEVDGMDNL